VLHLLILILEWLMLMMLMLLLLYPDTQTVAEFMLHGSLPDGRLVGINIEAQNYIP